MKKKHIFAIKLSNVSLVLSCQARGVEIIVRHGSMGPEGVRKKMVERYWEILASTYGPGPGALGPCGLGPGA